MTRRSTLKEDMAILHSRKWLLALCVLFFLLLAMNVSPAQSITVRYILAIGDSKTWGYGDVVVNGVYLGYPSRLVYRLNTTQPGVWREDKPRLGRGGYTLDMMVALQNNDMALPRPVPDYILIDLGTNDVNPRKASLYLTNPPAWTSLYAHYIETWHAKYPNAHIGLAFPRRYDVGYGNASFAQMDAFIYGILSTHPYTFEGVHESAYLPAHSVDRIHPNPLGYVVETTLWTNLIHAIG